MAMPALKPLWALFLALGLCLASVGTGPLHTVSALADDDGGGDDGGGDDDDDDGGGRDSTRSGDRAKASKAAIAKKKVIKKKQVQAPRPVIVALDLPDTASPALRRQGFVVISDERLSATGLRIMRLRLPANMSVRRANQVLGRLGSKAVDLNAFYTPQSQDACVEGQICGVRSVIGWNASGGTVCPASPRIGLVDTHLQLEHPALAGQKIEVIDVKPAGRKPSSLAHGTGIAALLAGARGSNAEGLLPDAELIVATPFYRAGNGDRAEAADIIRAIDAVVARNPVVLNLSLAGPPNAALAEILERVAQKGIPVVAAAGNDGSRSKPLYPAGYDTTIAVTAVASDLKIFRRAPRGGHIDFAAPGVEVRLADGKGGITRSSGTSFAAPFLSASIALMREREPDMTIGSIVAELADNARDLGRPGKDQAFGWGLVNAASLCQQASIDYFEPAGR